MFLASALFRHFVFCAGKEQSAAATSGVSSVDDVLSRMPSLLDVCKKIIAFVLCGCCQKRRKRNYAGYYCAGRGSVSADTSTSRIQRNSTQHVTLRKRRETIPSQINSDAESKQDEGSEQYERSHRKVPETWELFNFEKFCKVSKDGGICWLDVSLLRLLTIIEKAVKMDILLPINNDVKHTSSAVDVMELFYQIKEATYEHIDADNISVTYKCVAKIIDDFCRCILFYIDEMTKKIKSLQEIGKTNGPFKVTSKMCSGINSSEYVNQSVDSFVSKMDLEEISRSLQDAHSGMFVTQWHHTLTNTVKNTSESAKRKVFEQLEFIVDQMEPTIKKLLLEESVSNKSPHHDTLLEYLSQNLLIMKMQLNSQHFEFMLICLWNCTTTNVHGFLNEDKKSFRPTFFKNLNGSLQRLQNFLKELDKNKEIVFTNIHDIVAPELSKETSDYIHQYHLERLSQQYSLAGLGFITVKMHFMDNTLKVEILNARDIIFPTKKPNGKCNPYIKMQVLPKDKYKSVGKIKTKVQKNTLYPIFDETFLINLTAEQCNVNNAIIRFTLKSCNKLRINGTFLGESFALLSHVPTHNENSSENVQQQLLKLTRPMSTGCYSSQALKECKTEKIKKFIKKEKHKLKH